MNTSGAGQLLREMASVDVVVPCYRYGRYLRQCVRSVLDQEGANIRVLVIDDASPDETALIGTALATEDSRVTFRRHAVNQGRRRDLQRRHRMGARGLHAAAVG